MEAMGIKPMEFSVWQLPQQLLKKPEKGNIYYDYTLHVLSFIVFCK